jgi:non-specific serine/threonine protein kinase
MQQAVAERPSSELPAASTDIRFERIRGVAEWVEAYRPGHCHPVHIGDSLKQGRYSVLRKLGYGSFSTVWLAHDHEYVSETKEC